MVRGRQLTGCERRPILDPVAARKTRAPSSNEVLRELYLRASIEDEGLLEDLDLGCLMAAPFGLFKIETVRDHYCRLNSVQFPADPWRDKAATLSARLEGREHGRLSGVIARALDPRLGEKRLAKNRHMHVPIDLSRPLHEQWRETRIWLDDLADYVYRFTSTKRPRRRKNTYRDVFIFLSVAVERRTVFSVAREVFPNQDDRPSREKTVLEAIRKVKAVVRKEGIALPSPNDITMPK